MANWLADVGRANIPGRMGQAIQPFAALQDIEVSGQEQELNALKLQEEKKRIAHESEIINVANHPMIQTMPEMTKQKFIESFGKENMTGPRKNVLATMDQWLKGNPLIIKQLRETATFELDEEISKLTKKQTTLGQAGKELEAQKVGNEIKFRITNQKEYLTKLYAAEAAVEQQIKVAEAAPPTTLEGVLARGEKFTPEQQKAWDAKNQKETDRLLRAQDAALDKQIQAIDDDINRTNLEIAKLDPMVDDQSIPRLNAELERLQNRRAALYQGKKHLGVSVPEQFLPKATAPTSKQPAAVEALTALDSLPKDQQPKTFAELLQFVETFTGKKPKQTSEPKPVNGKVVSKKRPIPLSQQKTGLSPTEIDKQHYQRGRKVRTGAAEAWGQLKAVRPIEKPPGSPFSRMFQ